MPLESKSPEQAEITQQPSTGLVSLPEGGSPALSEIINRSLSHIQTNKTLAAPERRAGEEQEFEIAPGVKIVMCWIPAGDFLMGSPEDEIGRWHNETQHRVTITQGFWLGKYQITQAQWETVMGSNPSYFKASNFPVECVSWNAISETAGFMDKVNRFAAAGTFSLPTEAQWEYACRAETVTSLNSGKNLTAYNGACPNLDEVAWYHENSGHKTHPVGQKKANHWGLHDMHGNLWEWCSDWYGAYPAGAEVDPRGPDSGSIRVFRGCSWNDGASSGHVAARLSYYPSGSSDSVGFRLARSSVPKITSGDIERTDSMEQVTNAVHVVTSEKLSKLHRIGDHELQWPDYQLVCAWAEQSGIQPTEVLLTLLEPKLFDLSGSKTTLVDGRFFSLSVGPRLQGIKSFPLIEGLKIEEIFLDFFDFTLTTLVKENQLAEFNLSSFPYLRVLECDGIKLIKLNLLPVSNLRKLSCSGNLLTEIDLSLVPNLRELNCSRNPLTDLNLSPVPNLTLLWCNENQLTDLDLSPVTNLTKLSCCKNQLKNLDLSPVANLTMLRCDGNQLADLDLSPLPNLTELVYDGNHLADLDLSPVPNLKLLGCCGNSLIELDLSGVPNLEELACGENALTDLDLTTVPHLRVLSCSENELTDLDLSPVPNLEDLDCDSNLLTDLDLSVVSNLKELHCGNNQLTDLNLESVSNLNELNCRFNQLSELDLSPVANLTTLACYGNQLTELDLAHVPNLTHLDCEDNQLIELDISKLQDLEDLECDSICLIQRPDQNFK